MKREELKIATSAGPVSGILDRPDRPVAALTLAHGAGAGMKHAFMSDLAAALTAKGLAVLRFHFPYIEAGKKRTDPPAVATSTVDEAVKVLQQRLPGLPVFASGKSFGSRMSTTAAADGKLAGIRGVICFGFPLHPAKRIEVKRAEHLAKVPVKMLFLQGTRDDLADLAQMRKVCAKLPQATLQVVEGADHGFAVLKRSGRTADEVMAELADATVEFVKNS